MRYLSSLCAGVIALASIAASAAAAIQTGPAGPPRPLDHQVHGARDGGQRSPAPRGPAPLGPSATPVTGCSASAVANLGPADWVAYLRRVDYACMYFLWSYQPSLASVFSDNHVRAVLAEIDRQLPSYRASNPGDVLELMYYVRIFYYYVGSQHPDFLNRNVAGETQRTLDSFAVHPDLNTFAEVPARVTTEWILAADGASLGHRYLTRLQGVLADFVDPAQKRWGDYYQQINAWAIAAMVSRALRNNEPNMVAAVATNTALIDRLSAVARHGALLKSNPDGTYVINNAIWALGMIVYRTDTGTPANISTPSYGTWKHALYALAALVDYHAYLSAPYLWLVTVIDGYSDCNLSLYRRPVCRAVVAADVERLAFPNRYEMDDGNMVFYTPLSLAEVQVLYHAVKVVRAQFNRVTETVLPLPGDPNRTLNVRVYGSRADYDRFHAFLYGLNTNNGGVYIEQDGTFYTYDRAPGQSLYTLEELFRHEYAHYLVGRWIIPGMWGESASYANNRLVWFDEGFAEFMAGATRSQGVRARRTLIELVAADGANRMTVSEVLNASYGGDFRFYRYSGLFWNFLYDNDPGTMRQILALARDLDTASGRAAFDALIAGLRADPAVETAYQAALDAQIANVATATNPAVTVPPLASLSTGDPALLQTAFRTTRLGYYADCAQVAWRSNARFVCAETLVGPVVPSRDYVDAWQRFDGDLDDIITELAGTSTLNNFDTMSCSLGPISFASYGNGYYAYAAYFCEGPLAPNQSVPLDAVTRALRAFHTTSPGASASCVAGANATQSVCTMWLATSWYTASQSASTLQADLDQRRVVMTNEVYAADPTVDLTCALSGSPYVDAGNHYMASMVSCTVN